MCPNCRKKQSGKGKFIIIAAVVVIIAALASNGNDDKPKEVVKTDGTNSSAQTESKEIEITEAETNAPETEKTEFGAGETVELKGIQATLVSVTESEGADYTTPSEGNVFLICEFEIVNNSNSEITVSSMLSFDGYIDDYSTSYSLTGLLATDKAQLDGTVAAGKKMNGVIAFEVPVDWEVLEIKYTPNFWSGKDITFIYNK